MYVHRGIHLFFAASGYSSQVFGGVSSPRLLASVARYLIRLYIYLLASYPVLICLKGRKVLSQSLDVFSRVHFVDLLPFTQLRNGAFR
jgi:hypothetical protein